MAIIQKYLIEFHEKIKLVDTEENQVLRDKRDIVLERLEKNISADAPSYTTFNQGSYAMGTGIQPIDGEYDIDVGIRLNLSKDDYPDPVIVKKWIYEAIKNHTNTVEVKRPCVTVTYLEKGEPCFHIDLAVYAANNDDGNLYLAKGKLNSADESKEWELSNPLDLINEIKNKFNDGNDRSQFKRVIRYLKRWRDVSLASEGNASPVGIGITVLAHKYFMPSKVVDRFSGKTTDNDLESMKQLVQSILNAFSPVYDLTDEEYHERVKAILPVEPKTDVFMKMTNSNMKNFKEKLNSLKESLEFALDEVDPYEACKELNKKFGKDFPIPLKEDTGKRNQKPAISYSGGSA